MFDLARRPVLMIVGLAVTVAIHPTRSAEFVPRKPWTTSRVQGLPTPPPPYKVVDAFPHLTFSKPTSLTEMPGLDRLMVTQMDGKIFSFIKAAETSADLVVDFADSAGGVSLFHATFHPNFRQNGYVFVCMGHPAGGRHTRVSRFTISKESQPRIDPASEQVIIRWPTGGHNGGCLQFGKDGYLYISTGDGAGPNPPDGLTTGQDISDLLGAVLRIDVNRSADNLNYAIPPDNPFLETENARPEIWSYGLRNPWKFGIDQETGDIFVCDNGWETWELVHKLSRGSNCGWPIMEGRARLRTEVPRGPTPIVPPIKDHSHTEANSVIGGPVYRGPMLPELQGTFVYGDYITGTIWGLKDDAAGGYAHSTLVDTDLRIVAFAEGSRGELYVLDYDFTGKIYELQPSGRDDNSADFPRRLSETGIFASLEGLTPAEGVVPYSVIAERWTDGAAAERWVAIPKSDSIQLSTEPTSSDFPEGTVFVKQLNLARADGSNLRLETQLLHFEHGVWNPYSYLWNEDGTDALLVDSIGAAREISVSQDDSETKRTWHANAVNECRLCHNANAGVVLGFTSKQLKRIVGGRPVDQLSALVGQRVLRQPIVVEDGTPLVDPHSSKHTTEDRARSYLHANCSMCHHRGGTAIVSFYLHRDYPFDELQTNKGTGIGTFGMRNAKIISPGDPYRSVVTYRMSKLGAGRMPYVGSRVVDSKGVTLVNAWIRSMDAQDTDRSAPVTPETAEFNSLQTLSPTSSNPTSVATLLKSTEGSLALVNRMHAGDVSTADQKLVLDAAKGEMKSDIRGLVDPFIPEADRRKTLGRTPDPQSILGLDGDRNRGELIFRSDDARCRTCHDTYDDRKSLGPTLAAIRKKYKLRGELLKHTLNPSLQSEDIFAAWVLATVDGHVFHGLLVQQDEQSVLLKTAEQKMIRIPQAKIDHLAKSPRSLMPDGILSDLTPQEAADLLTFVGSE